jgi:tetratricopeptide (TPR) repeat protein
MGTTLLDHHTRRLCLWGLAITWLCLGCSPSEKKPLVDKPSTEIPSSTTAAIPPLTESFEARLKRAEELFANNKFDEAWTISKELLIQEPKSVPALFVASQIMAARNNLSGAIQLISQIDPADPKAGPAATGQLSEWLARSGDIPGAEAKLRGLLKEYPTAVPALKLLTAILHAQGRRWDAGKVLDRIVRLGNFTTPDLMNLVDLHDPSDEQELRMAFEQFAPDNPLSQLGEVRLRLYADRWKDCIDRLAALTKSNPQQLEPWIWYGEALLETAQIDKLPEWLKTPPDGHSRHPEYWYIAGRYWMLESKWDTAARCFAEALELDRRHIGSMQSLSECLMELKLTEQALEVREQAGKLVRIKDLSNQIRRGSAKDQAYFEIAKLYEQFGDKVLAFGWEVIALTQTKQPVPERLIALQKELQSGKVFASPILEKLPFKSWPLPDDQSQTLAESNVLSEPSQTTTSSAIQLDDIAQSLGLVTGYDNGSKGNKHWTTLEGLGGGVSAIDYDKDGWPDLFFSQAGDSPLSPTPNYLPKQLFRSIQGARFTAVEQQAHVGDLGYGQGTGVSDIDQDGLDDLLIANLGHIHWYRNQGDGTFESVWLPQAPPAAIWNSAIQAADLNGDSLPDIVQCAYIDGDEFLSRTCPTPMSPESVFCHPKRFTPGKTRILWNQGDGSWKLADKELLDSLVDGYALGVLITNIDGQAGNDAFFANDVSPNHLLLSFADMTNRSDGMQSPSLQEMAMRSGVAVDHLGRAQASMGIACGDQDRDGSLDLIVTNFRFEVSTLYRQMRPGLFIDATRMSKLGEPTLEWLSFGCQLSDLDNDGWLDFVTVNGHIDYLDIWQMPPQVLQNDKGKFRWLKSPSPGKYFDSDNVGRSLTALDFNRDGRIDFAVTHLDRPSALLANSTQTPNHFVQLELVGTRSERNATGALVRAIKGEESWIATASVGDGYYGTNERVIHLGIGPHSSVDRIEIQWPSGQKQSFENVQADRRYGWVEGSVPYGIPLAPKRGDQE